MNTFMDRVNAIVQKNQMPQAMMGQPEPAYPDAGIGALENVVSGAPRQTEIMGQPHMLAYINPQEEALIQSQRGGMPALEGSRRCACLLARRLRKLFRHESMAAVRGPLAIAYSNVDNTSKDADGDGHISHAEAGNQNLAGGIDGSTR